MAEGGAESPANLVREATKRVDQRRAAEASRLGRQEAAAAVTADSFLRDYNFPIGAKQDFAEEIKDHPPTTLAVVAWEEISDEELVDRYVSINPNDVGLLIGVRNGNIEPEEAAAIAAIRKDHINSFRRHGSVAMPVLPTPLGESSRNFQAVDGSLRVLRVAPEDRDAIGLIHTIWNPNFKFETEEKEFDWFRIVSHLSQENCTCGNCQAHPEALRLLKGSLIKESIIRDWEAVEKDPLFAYLKAKKGQKSTNRDSTPRPSSFYAIVNDPNHDHPPYNPAVVKLFNTLSGAFLDRDMQRTFGDGARAVGNIRTIIPFDKRSVAQGFYHTGFKSDLVIDTTFLGDPTKSQSNLGGLNRARFCLRESWGRKILKIDKQKFETPQAGWVRQRDDMFETQPWVKQISTCDIDTGNGLCKENGLPQSTELVSGLPNDFFDPWEK